MGQLASETKWDQSRGLRLLGLGLASGRAPGS